MTTEERIKKQKGLVEEIGRYFDKEGLQPIAGRVLGLLMVMDKEQYTFEEIVEELQISKSSASNTLKNLDIRGEIEYVTLPGDRKRYFQLKKKNTFALIEDFENKMNCWKDLLDNISALKADKNANNVQYFSAFILMIDFFLGKIKILKSEFEK